MKRAFCFLVFLTFLSAGRADLGETLAQCRVRYGDPVERKLAPNLDEMVLFKKNDIKYGVGLKDDKCVILILGRVSSDGLSQTEVADLLKANSGQSFWRKSTPRSKNEIWTREDGFAVAQFDPLYGILTLVSTQYMKAEMARKKAAGG